MHNNLKLKTQTVIVVTVLSAALRLINIDSPILESHSFRQTQTALTIRNFAEEGIKFFEYETPLFGPPWRVPFEFPTFQISAALLAKAGIKNIDAAGRITNIFYFYISALFLYLISTRFFKEKQPPLFILFYYLFNPYTILWSRTCMIDYCSVAFSTGYLFFLIRWLETKEKPFSMYLSLGFGILAYLTKITTVFVFIPLMAAFSVYQLWDRTDNRKGLLSEKKLIALIIIAIPFICGYAWVLYTDYIKNSSPFTAWLSSKNLTDWNYGTFKQRLDGTNWLKIADHLHVLVPGFLALLLPFGFWYALKENKKIALFFLFSLIGVLFEISSFFNLYVIHNYYLMAVSPVVSTVIGISLYAFFCKFTRGNKIVLFTAIIIITLTTLPALSTTLTFPLLQNKYPPKITLPDFLQTITQSNEYLVIADFDWNPRIIYYSNRKGFMLREKYTTEMGEFLKKYNFTTVLLRNPNPELLSNWRYVLEIEPGDFHTMNFHVFKVTDNPETMQKWKDQFGLTKG
ncbi:ArnT family glycosyltransferase [Candidatus Magnetomonas plexicatena]|uniref:ArnT family glycosyltransferase n=1 Tax=Candidatus Magnetomonas plexicatena TaxID=2552947 RepID=UPI001100A7D0|nr:hypothetical protein E2O03_003105 [Nitrospirales bacterium LBB_01]